jgi:uncharacterized membrane protein YphA (DoxX/SURF4 family)
MSGLATGVALILAAAMAIGGTLNLAGPAFVREEFARWGYPGWLRPAVGVVEWVAALLLLLPATRPFGAALALAVLVGVLASLARDRAWLRCEYPAVLLVIALLVLSAS